jgi:spore germination cell wall hydrolase CwlJ-like protein
MSELAIQPSAPIESSGRVRRAVLGVAAAAAVFLLVTGLAGHVFRQGPAQDAPVQAPEIARLQMMTEGAQADILGNGADAAQRNKLIPVSGYSGGAVAPFRAIAPDTSAYDIARKCLTQAIYYEAGNQSVEGKRAVAQVVLNRVRHPAYPHSVCGVVYEGWNGRTCQFTFVCDGSLLRAPVPALWRESEEVAAEALDGQTEKAVGSATNYHADYVLPRWAFTLPKITQLGAHIFYRLPGRWGSAEALTARWDGHEAIPNIDYQGLRERLAAETQEIQPATPQLVPGLTVTPLISDRHAPDDVGGRIDTTKPWRLSIPIPVSARPAPAVQPAGDEIGKVQGEQS